MPQPLRKYLSSDTSTPCQSDCLATSYRRILSHFNADIKNPDLHIAPSIPYSIPIIGFSATFSRHDGLALGSVFEKIVYHRDFLDMIQEQWQVYLYLCVASRS